MPVPFLERVAQGLGGCAASRGVIAVSGGPDSVALARALVHWHRQGRIGPLLFAHLNHQLRGAESDADEVFVQDLARQLGVPCRTHRHDVAALARRRGGNLESCGRQVRYDWLTQVAREEDAAWIATGHTADDQAQTVLFRLLRGTGLQGLGGIPARRELAASLVLLRPLLQVTRAEVLTFLEELQQPYRQDSSNRNLDLTRNRLRLELLPHLAEHYNPAIVSVLCRLAEQAQHVQTRIAAEVEALLREVELPRAGGLVIITIARLSGVPRYLVREVLRRAWSREGWPMGEMRFADWERLADLVVAETGAVDFPGGIRARRVGGVLQVGKSS